MQSVTETIALEVPTPLLVAVTGHRDIRACDVERLSAAIDEFFETLERRFANSQIVVLSALAAGADRLAASRARARGTPIVALLPMPAGDYRADFTEPEDRASFDELLASSASVIELPWPSALLPSEYADPDARIAQYAAVGQTFVQNAAILLALWDGRPSVLRGGTADVIAMARAAAHPTRTLLAPVEHHLAPLVYHIVTPRASEPGTVGVAFSHSQLDAPGDAATLHTIAQQDRWNADARTYVRDGGGPTPFVLDRDFVARTFAIADALAIREQVAAQRAFARIYLLAGLATLSFATYADLLDDFNALLYLAVTVTLTGVFAYVFATKRGAADSFQDYRALAEGLRIQIAWLQAGIGADVGDYYLRRHGSLLDLDDTASGSTPANKLDWIRRTIRVAHRFATLGSGAARPGTHEGARERYRAVLQDWIAPQAAYFERAAKRKRVAADRYRMGWKLAAAIATALTVALTVAVSIPALHDSLATRKACFFFGIGVAGIFSAFLQNYAEKRAFATLAKQYETMHRTFSHARDVLASMVDGDFHENGARALVFELGTEALSENAEWVIALRDRPLEMILTG